MSVKVKTGLKAGGLTTQHNRRVLRSGLKVHAGIKAGGFTLQHNRRVR